MRRAEVKGLALKSQDFHRLDGLHGLNNALITAPKVDGNRAFRSFPDSVSQSGRAALEKGEISCRFGRHRKGMPLLVYRRSAAGGLPALKGFTRAGPGFEGYGRMSRVISVDRYGSSGAFIGSDG